MSKKIEKELEKLPPDTQEYVRQLLEYLKNTVQQYGTLPTHNEEPAFYDALNALFETLKAEGAKISLKDIATYLGVDYAHLRKQRSLHRREKEEYGLSDATQQQATMPDAEIAPPSASGAALPAPPASTVETAVKAATARQVEKKIVDTIKKKVEDVIKEETDLIFRLGKEFYERYRAKCYANGHDNLVECMNAAVDFYFENRGAVEMLQSELENCKNTVKYLLMMEKPHIRRAMLLEKARQLINASATLPPSLQKQLIDKVIHMLERVVYAA